MKMFLVLIAIIGIHPIIAQKKKYVLSNYQERQNQHREADIQALKVADSVVKEAEKKYDENMKSGITNISHNAEPWWVSVNTNESQEEINTYNSESSDIESTEKTSYPIKTWQIVAGIVACILLFYEGVKYVVRRIKKSTKM